VERRIERGHWEIDTVMGSGKGCVLALVERVSGYVMIGKLDDHGGQRLRVSWLWEDRGAHRSVVLLRQSPSLLGARNE